MTFDDPATVHEQYSTDLDRALGEIARVLRPESLALPLRVHGRTTIFVATR
jgi:hypothetical protein